MRGKGGIIDAEHDFEIEKQAAHIEIGAADIDKVINQDQLRMQPRWRIFEDADAFSQQPRISESRRADGRHIIGFRRRHDPRLAALTDAVEAAEHRRVRREIGSDHRQAFGGHHIVAHAARPRRQPPHRPAEQPARIARRIAPVAQRLAQVTHFGLGALGPALQRIEIARQPLGSFAFDHQAEITPRLFACAREIIHRDIEPADNRARIIGKRHLLMIAQQIAPSPARVESADVDPGGSQRHEECVMGRRIAAKAVDDKSDRHMAGSRREQRIMNTLPGGIIGINIIEQLEARLRAVDERNQRIKPFGPVGQKRKMIAVDVERWGHSDALARAMLLLQAALAKRRARIQQQDFKGSVRWRA